MPRTEADPRSPSFAMLALILAVALLPLFTTPLLPFIDLYNHVARFFVLAHVGSDPALAANYVPNWGLLPNIGLDLAGTALLHVLPARWAAHVVVTAIFIVQYSGVLAFNRALTGRSSLLVALLAVPLLYSYILNWGFANFLLGLGLVFWAAAWWLTQRRRLALAVPVASLLAVAIFFTHGLAFALYGVLLGGLEIGLWLQQRPRRPGGLVRALLPVAVQAVVPVLLFLAAPTSRIAGGVTNADGSAGRLYASGRLAARLWELFQYRLITIVRVAEGPSLWFDAVTFAVTAGIVLWLLARHRITLARPAWAVLAIAAVLVAAMPPALFGVGYVADRMPLFLALLLTGSLAAGPAAPGVRTAEAVLALLAAVRLAAIGAGWQSYARADAEFRQVAAQIPPGSLVDDLVVGGMPRNTTGPRYAMYRPLLISEHRQIGPLFANEAQQPLRLVGQLRAVVDRLPKGSWSGNMPMSFYDDFLAAMPRAGFRYVLLCNGDRLTRPLPPSARTVARTPHFTLLRFDAPAAP